MCSSYMSFSAQDKVRIVCEVLRGGISPSSISKKYSVPVRSLYRWIEIYKKAPSFHKKRSLTPKYVSGQLHPRSISLKTQKQIKRIIFKYPSWGCRRISLELFKMGHKLGYAGVNSYLKRIGAEKEEERVLYKKLWAGPGRIEATIKLSIVRKIVSGETIANISKGYNIPRRTIQRWLKTYRDAENVDILGANLFKEAYARGIEHPKAIYPKIEGKTLDLVRANPGLSVHRLTEYLPASSWTIWKILEKHNLNLYSQRLAFAKQGFTERKLPVPSFLDRIRSVWQEFIPSLAPAPPPPPSLLKPFLASAFASFATSFLLISWISILGKSGSFVGVLGLTFASLALLMGSFFFLYSLKYYLTLALVLSFSQEGKGEGEIGIEVRGKSLVGWLLGLGGGRASEHRAANLTKAGGLEANLEHVKLTRHPFVSIHIPLYNEKNVVERLINASTSFDYEGEYEVILCDDSTDETSTIIREYQKKFLGKGETLKVVTNNQEGWSISQVEVSPGVTLKHLKRTSRKGFKGGALRLALKLCDTRTEFISVFDADFVPYPDTLELFLKYFQVTAGTLDFKSRNPKSQILNSKQYQNLNDPNSKQFRDLDLEFGVSSSNIAAVQGYQWHVLNKSENWITRGVRSEYAGSYVIERSGTEIYSGLKQISGSVYMIRRDVLEEVGWETSITEDFQLTLKLYEAGYKVVYTPYIQAPAECVSTIKRLVRQRMRWAEGHSNNIKRMFVRLMFGHWEEKTVEDGGSKMVVEGGRSNVENQSSNRQFIPSPLTLSEKLEFLYLSPYYLQAFFFLIGTLSWLISETVFRAHLPFWTELWGWSLVLTNLLALPLMNAVGLFLEESEEKDYAGLASFVALSYILVPFQAYASLKGFLERSEGPWFRTPKTGRITDIFARGRFYRFISGILPGRTGNRVQGIGYSALNPNSLNPYLSPSTANSRFDNFNIVPRRKKWVGRLILSFLLILTVSVYSVTKGVPEVLATNPSSCNGTNCTFYLHDSASTTLTGTTAEWKLDVSADVTDSTTTVISVNNKLTEPLWFQYKPGTTNSTAESAQSCSSNTPDNAGWFFDTPFQSGGSIPAGTWSFYYNETDNRSGNVGNMTICAWDVTVSGGVINTSSLLFEVSHSGLDTLDHWDAAVNNTVFAFGGSIYSLSADHYLYVEYFSSLTTISSAGPSTNYTSTLRTGPTYGDPRIITPQITIPENAIFLLVVVPSIPFLVIWIKKSRSNGKSFSE